MKQDSTLVSSHDDTLQVYQLPLQKVMDKSDKLLAKYSLGKLAPGIPKVEKVLMVLGATGAGKSTLINGMINYILGVKWNDNFRFKLIGEECSKNQAHSQTSLITAYTIYPSEGSQFPYTFTIVDTPGFGDTRGMERDKKITEQIHAFFSIQGENGIDHLDGIGFVTQASLARLTPTQRYIFHSILSIFGKDIANNIFMMVTFADGQHPPVMTAIEEADIPCKKFFKFNNSALFAKNVLDDEHDETEHFDEMFWKMGSASFRKFFKAFCGAEAVSLLLTKEVLRERKQLETTVQGLQQQINAGVAKLEELRQEEQILQQREAEIASNKNFIYKVKVTKQRKNELEPGVYVTNCLTCNYTCHERCAYSNDADKYKCSAMDNGGVSNAKCKVCPNHCIWKDHVNNPYWFELYTDMETRTSEDLKKKYNIALEGKTKVESMMANIDGYLRHVENQVMSMVTEVQRALERLDEIALKPNPLTQTEHLDVLIESEKQQAKPGFQQRIKFYEQAKKEAGILNKTKSAVEYISRQDQQPALPEGEEGKKKPWYKMLLFWQRSDS